MHPNDRTPSGLAGGPYSLSSQNQSHGGAYPPSQHGANNSVSFNGGAGNINKYETQTKRAQDQMHPLRGDPAMLSQPIGIRLDHDRDTMPVRNHKMFRNVASIEIAEIKDALSYAEQLLAKNLAEKEKLMQKDVEHQFEIKRVEDRCSAVTKERQNAEAEVKQLNHKFKQLENNQEMMQDQVKQRLGTLQQEINAGKTEVSQLNGTINQREIALSEVAISSQLNNDQRQQLEEVLRRKDNEIDRLQKELDRTRISLDTIVLQRRAEGTVQLQAEAYRQENARLLALLAKTPQYSQFAEFAIDAGSGVRYMNATNPTEQAPSPNKSTRQKPCTVTYSADPNEGLGEENGDEWIPDEAYRVAHDFRNRCTVNVSKALMNTLLSDLNKVWRQREKKQISRIKSDANREVQYLRREVAFKKPYAQVMHEQSEKRLKGELKDAHQALRENVAVIKQDRDGPNFGLNLVDHTVRHTNEIQVERRRLQQENERLQQRVSQLENGRLM